MCYFVNGIFCWRGSHLICVFVVCLMFVVSWWRFLAEMFLSHVSVLCKAALVLKVSILICVNTKTVKVLCNCPDSLLYLLLNRKKQNPTLCQFPRRNKYFINAMDIYITHTKSKYIKRRFLGRYGRVSLISGCTITTF